MPVVVDDAIVFAKLQAVIRERFPDFEVRYKDESAWHRVFGRIVFPVNPRYMADFVTTFGRVVWMPSREWAAIAPGRAWRLLAHEHVHMLDAINGGREYLWRLYRYQFAALALTVVTVAGAVAARHHWGWLWRVAAVVLAAASVRLLRYPNDDRLTAEVRGYAAGFCADWWTGFSITAAEINQLAALLASGAHWWCARAPEVAKGRLQAALNAVQLQAPTEAPDGAAYRDLAEALSRAGALRRPTYPGESLRPRV